MRYDREHKQRTRTRIVQAAAADIRKQGAEAMRVGDVMARVGLTHGGFYAHFASKEALVSEAIAEAFDERYADFPAFLDDPDPAAALARFIRSYLSEAHVAAPELGCPMPALMGEVARSSDAVRHPMEAGLDRLIAGVEQLLSRMGKPDAQQLAMSVMSEMVGALSLARIVTDESRRRHMLRQSRSALLARLGLV